MDLSAVELRGFVDQILAEDIGPGDITSESVIPENAALHAVVTARQPLVLAGLPVAAEIFKRLDPGCEIDIAAADGDELAANDIVLRVRGGARSIFGAERAALNVLQHLSGIATLTRTYVRRIEGTGAVLLDTRKTIPGLRRLAKYAARTGGARNHRMGLHDAILIKDNHIAVAGGVAAAINAARSRGHSNIEIECDTLAQAEQALAAGAGRILLDNMSPESLRQVVALTAGRVSLEASGGVTLENIRGIAETGVDYISVGRITQSAPAVDIGLDVVDI